MLAGPIAAASSSQQAHDTFTCTNCGGSVWWLSVLTAVLAGVIAAGTGSFFAFKFSQKLLADQTAEQIKLMTWQTRHDTAKGIDDALGRIEKVAHYSEFRRDDWLETIDLISDEMYGKFGQLNSPELAERIKTLHFTALRMLQVETPGNWATAQYGVTLATDDLRRGLREFIAGDDISKSWFAPVSVIFEQVFPESASKPDFERYWNWLIELPEPS